MVDLEAIEAEELFAAQRKIAVNIAGEEEIRWAEKEEDNNEEEEEEDEEEVLKRRAGVGPLLLTEELLLDARAQKAGRATVGATRGGTGGSTSSIGAFDLAKAPLVLLICQYDHDLSWALLQPFPYIIYSKKLTAEYLAATEDNASSPLPLHFVRRNTAREVPAYLKFIHDYYDVLPQRVLFLHGHRSSIHQQDLVPLLHSFHRTFYTNHSQIHEGDSSSSSGNGGSSASERGRGVSAVTSPTAFDFLGAGLNEAGGFLSINELAWHRCRAGGEGTIHSYYKQQSEEWLAEWLVGGKNGNSSGHGGVDWSVDGSAVGSAASKMPDELLSFCCSQFVVTRAAMQVRETIWCC
jgi:hypothetical protein